MYQELLDIVRTADQVDDTESVSTDATAPAGKGYEAKMPVVLEESGENFPSFSEKQPAAKAKLERADSFDAVLDSVLAENKGAGAADSDSDDDDLDADRDAANPLKDFTFVGDHNLMGARGGAKKSKPQPKPLQFE